MTETGRSEKIKAIMAFSRVCAVRLRTSSPEAELKVIKQQRRQRDDDDEVKTREENDFFKLKIYTYCIYFFKCGAMFLKAAEAKEAGFTFLNATPVFLRMETEFRVYLS